MLKKAPAICRSFVQKVEIVREKINFLTIRYSSVIIQLCANAIRLYLRPNAFACNIQRAFGTDV